MGVRRPSTFKVPSHIHPQRPSPRCILPGSLPGSAHRLKGPSTGYVTNSLPFEARGTPPRNTAQTKRAPVPQRRVGPVRLARSAGNTPTPTPKQEKPLDREMFSFLHRLGLGSVHSISKAEHHAKHASVTGGEITNVYRVAGIAERRPSNRAPEDAIESPRKREKGALGAQDPGDNCVPA